MPTGAAGPARFALKAPASPRAYPCSSQAELSVCSRRPRLASQVPGSFPTCAFSKSEVAAALRAGRAVPRLREARIRANLFLEFSPEKGRVRQRVKFRLIPGHILSWVSKQSARRAVFAALRQCDSQSPGRRFSVGFAAAQKSALCDPTKKTSATFVRILAAVAKARFL